ncbi:MAG: mechanosensitive ion channel domain-containing protein [Candidatus Thermoplasmatota archaeon]|nr:mechanosensitive ion channel domain-containing protein [Candidatus Thermoplasmatota archaeon]
MWEVLEQISGLDFDEKIGFAAAVLVFILGFEIYVVMRVLERFTDKHQATWSDVLFKPLRNRFYLLTVVITLNLTRWWLSPDDMFQSISGETAPSVQSYFYATYILLATSIVSVSIKHVLPSTLAAIDSETAVVLSGGHHLAVLVSRVVVWVAGINLAFQEVQIEMFGMLASLAVFSIFLGLAVQQTMGNILNSFLLDIDHPFEVGDRIQVGEHRGIVVSMGVLSTKLLTLEEELVVIPNNTLVASTLINSARGGGDGKADRVTLRLEIGVSFDEDPNHIKAILLIVAHGCEYILEKPRPRVLMTEFGDYSKKFMLYAWLDDYNNERFARDLLLMDIDAAFEREGIQIPYPTTHEMRALPSIDPETLKVKNRARRSSVAFMRKEGMLLDIEEEERLRAEEVRSKLLMSLEKWGEDEDLENPSSEDTG